MDSLKQTLYILYSNELMNLNIGYTLNETVLRKMLNIISTLEYIKFNDCIDKNELIKLYSMYEM